MKSSLNLLVLAPLMAYATLDQSYVEEDQEVELFARDDDNDEDDEQDSNIVRPTNTINSVAPMTSVVSSLQSSNAVTISSVLAAEKPYLTGIASQKQPKDTSNNYNQKYENSSQHVNLGIGPQPIVKPDKNHTKMELGIAFGVVSIFILFAICIFGYYRLRGKGKTPKFPDIMNRFRKEKDMENLGHQTDYFRQPVSAVAMPKKPEPVMTEKRDLEAAPLSRSVSNSSRQSSRGSPERGRTRGSNLQPMIMSSSPPRYLERTSSILSDRSTNSSRSSGLPIGGPRLPRIPSQNQENPFTDRGASRDPFQDEDMRSISSHSSIRSPAPLRIVTKDLGLKKATLDRTKSNASTLVLTDPRVAGIGALSVANSDSSSVVPPLPAPLKSFKGSKKIMKQDLPFLHLPANPKQGPDSRFSWTTKATTPAPSIHRKSNISSSESDGAPQFRGIRSWVDHQTERTIRHPSDGPGYARTVTDYDARSDNSGMDTRRTYYEDV